MRKSVARMVLIMMAMSLGGCGEKEPEAAVPVDGELSADEDNIDAPDIRTGEGPEVTASEKAETENIWDKDRPWTDRDDILPHAEDGYVVFGAYEQDIVNVLIVKDLFRVLFQAHQELRLFLRLFLLLRQRPGGGLGGKGRFGSGVVRRRRRLVGCRRRSARPEKSPWARCSSGYTDGGKGHSRRPTPRPAGSL